LLPQHPIVRGVEKFSAEVSLRVVCKPASNATLISEWQDGTPWIAEKVNPTTQNSMVLALNMTGPSQKAFSGYWNPEQTDGVQLVYNSIVYTAVTWPQMKSLAWTQKLLKLAQQKQLTNVVINC